MQHSHRVDPPPQSAPPTRLLTRLMSLDDEIVDQMVCKRVIKRSGLADEVVGMTCPMDALQYLADPTVPDVELILLDVNMPRMNGFEFLQAAQTQLRMGQKMPPVLVMLSTPLGPLHRKQAREFDVIKGYLDKPLDRLALKNAILDIQTEPTAPCHPVVF